MASFQEVQQRTFFFSSRSLSLSLALQLMNQINPDYFDGSIIAWHQKYWHLRRGKVICHALVAFFDVEYYVLMRFTGKQEIHLVPHSPTYTLLLSESFCTYVL